MVLLLLPEHAVTFDEPDDVWWVQQLNMVDDYRTILYGAAYTFPDSEIENYPYLAEALWAKEHGL